MQSPTWSPISGLPGTAATHTSSRDSVFAATLQAALNGDIERVSEGSNNSSAYSPSAPRLTPPDTTRDTEFAATLQAALSGGNEHVSAPCPYAGSASENVASFRLTVESVQAQEMSHDAVAVLYDAEIHIGGYQHVTTKRFSDWLNLHNYVTNAIAEAPRQWSDLAVNVSRVAVPPKHRGHTLFGKVDKHARAGELFSWLKRLVSVPGIFANGVGLGVALELPPDMLVVATDVGEQQLQALRDQKAAAQRAENERKAAIARHLRELYDHAQTFSQMAPELTFTEQTRWKLRHRMFGNCQRYGSGANATITGPGERAFFKLLRLDRNLFNFSAKFAICNMNGDPLIFLHEQTELFSRSRMHVYRQSGASLHQVCEVFHKFFGGGSYHVNMHRKPAESMQPSACKVEGDWPRTHRYVADGRLAATMKDEFGFSDSHGLHIEANQDVLLMLAITVCIDCLHHHKN